MMKPAAFVLNRSAGALVIAKGLIEAPENKRIAEAGCDVPDFELTLKDNPQFKNENLILTPQTGRQTFKARERLVERLTEIKTSFIKIYRTIMAMKYIIKHSAWNHFNSLLKFKKEIRIC